MLKSSSLSYVSAILLQSQLLNICAILLTIKRGEHNEICTNKIYPRSMV